jgi:phenylpyruvate tautomerase PptA (4-oxalocrotonate tautomerase family)
VLEVRCRRGCRADDGRVEKTAARSQRDQHRPAGRDLKAPRREVTVRYRVAERVEGEPEQDGSAPRAGGCTSGGAGCDVHGDDHRGCSMPVVRVSALPQPAGVDVEAAAKAVALDLAALLGEEPRGTWVTWETFEPGLYVEGDVAPAIQPRATHPPLVRVVAAERPPELVERMLTSVAETLVRALGLEPGNVFAVFEQATPGRLYTGGHIVGR